VVERRRALEWVAEYEDAWRSPGVGALTDVFARDVVYVPSPWADPVRGIPALRRFWEAEREGSEEQFRMTSELVAVDGPTAIVRVEVHYGDGQHWRDLWIVTFDDDGRCRVFEEWPFAPEQADGH
jgi:ketosteroid isomerase-like protein